MQNSESKTCRDPRDVEEWLHSIIQHGNTIVSFQAVGIITGGQTTSFMVAAVWEPNKDAEERTAQMVSIADRMYEAAASFDQAVRNMPR